MGIPTGISIGMPIGIRIGIPTEFQPNVGGCKNKGIQNSNLIT